MIRAVFVVCSSCVPSACPCHIMMDPDRDIGATFGRIAPSDRLLAHWTCDLLSRPVSLLSLGPFTSLGPRKRTRGLCHSKSLTSTRANQSIFITFLTILLALTGPSACVVRQALRYNYPRDEVNFSLSQGKFSLEKVLCHTCLVPTNSLTNKQTLNATLSVNSMCALAGCTVRRDTICLAGIRHQLHLSRDSSVIMANCWSH